jgi:hypothetical protein
MNSWLQPEWLIANMAFFAIAMHQTRTQSKS